MSPTLLHVKAASVCSLTTMTWSLDFTSGCCNATLGAVANLAIPFRGSGAMQSIGLGHQWLSGPEQKSAFAQRMVIATTSWENASEVCW